MHISQKAAFIVSILLITGLGTSPALISICTVLIPILAIWRAYTLGWRIPEAARQIFTGPGMGMLVLWGLGVLSIFLSQDFPDWSVVLYRKLPLLLLPLGFAWLLPFSRKQMNWLAITLVLSQALVAVASLTQHMLGFSYLHKPIVEGGHIPIISGVSHIYFGVTLAFSSLLSGYMAWEKENTLFPRMHRIWWILAILNAILLHFFTSRTGLMAFYAGLSSIFIYAIIRFKAWKIALLGLGVLVVIPSIAYFSVPSFRGRIHNTTNDWSRFQNSEEDISYNSAALRLLAWQTAWELIVENPVIGAGLSQVQPNMAAQYEENGAMDRARKPLHNPHNQYLTYWIGYGFPGLIALFVVLLIPIIRSRPPTQMLGFALFGALSMALMFENILERQIGMTFFCVIYIWLPFWQHDRTQ